MDKAYYKEMKNNVDDLTKLNRLTGITVLTFGHCNATEEMIDYLLAGGFEVSAILDNNESKQGFTYRTATVKSPSHIQSYNASDSIVLITAKAYAPMADQLRNLGYDGEIIKMVDYNSFAEFSLSEDTFSRKKARVLRGAGTLNKIRERYPTQYLIVCPHDALGDVYWTLSFLSAYCGKHGIDEVAVVVAGNGCRQTAELFQTGNIITVLDRSDMDELVQAILFTHEENCIIAHHDRPYTDNIIRYLDKHFLSFTDYYRYAVFGLDKDTKPVLPTGNVAFTDMEQIEKGRTVILSPYAKSMVQIPDIFWESLAADYQKKGYLVCTNAAGDEKPVKDTKALSVPINQIVSAAENAGCFIGIRNGLCDVLTAARCRKVAVFPDCIYSSTNIKVDEFFRMHGWENVVWTASKHTL